MCINERIAREKSQLPVLEPFKPFYFSDQNMPSAMKSWMTGEPCPPKNCVALQFFVNHLIYLSVYLFHLLQTSRLTPAFTNLNFP